eukprot:3053657-Pyramimonas_sp.AAC.1
MSYRAVRHSHGKEIFRRDNAKYLDTRTRSAISAGAAQLSLHTSYRAVRTAIGRKSSGALV